MLYSTFSKKDYPMVGVGTVGFFWWVLTFNNNRESSWFAKKSSEKKTKRNSSENGGQNEKLCVYITLWEMAAILSEMRKLKKYGKLKITNNYRSWPGWMCLSIKSRSRAHTTYGTSLASEWLFQMKSADAYTARSISIEKRIWLWPNITPINSTMQYDIAIILTASHESLTKA